MNATARKTGFHVRGFIVIVVLAVASGCAVKQPLNHDPRDPWEGFNRQVFSFNESVDLIVLKPIASVYSKILPQPVRRGVANSFSNLEELPGALNNFLQADFSGGFNNLSRFVINSTFGVLGFFDLAAKAGMYRQQEDFGQTLAVWGVGEGAYVMLPLIGPSSMRGIPGKVVDFLVSPFSWMFDSNTGDILRGSEMVSKRSGFLEQEDMLRKLSPDFYAQLRGFYLNRREHLVRDGRVEIDEDISEVYEEL